MRATPEGSQASAVVPKTGMDVSIPAQSWYPRIVITQRPDQMAGVACIRGLRIPVATVIAMLADGMTEAEILRDYPDLTADDIRAAVCYAARMAADGPGD